MGHSVSILVLVDVGLRPGLLHPRARPLSGVSILVLVDVGLRRTSGVFVGGSGKVSILVLVDVGLRRLQFQA